MRGLTVHRAKAVLARRGQIVAYLSDVAGFLEPAGDGCSRIELRGIHSGRPSYWLAEGVELEVIDPRTLVPFDDATIVTSLAKTSRLLVVQEGPADGGWGNGLISRMMQHNWQLFDAPPRLVCSPSTPVPYAANLEKLALPTVEQVVQAAKGVCYA
mgnify:CR=1 FL=1